VTLSSGLLLKILKKMIGQKHEVNTADQDAPNFMRGVKFLQNIDSSTNQDIAKIEDTSTVPAIRVIKILISNYS